MRCGWVATQLQVCAALAAYAKAGHERADVFVTLARGISEVRGLGGSVVRRCCSGGGA